MKTFMLLSFVLLGWAFFVMSGGSDFKPERRVVAQASAPAIVDPAPIEEPGVDLALTTTTPTESDTIQERLATALVSPAVTEDALAPLIEAVTEDLASDTTAQGPDLLEVIADDAGTDIAAVVDGIVPEQDATVQAIDETTPDLRQVAGSRVNMRAGPSTEFSVLVTLDGGTTAEVIDRNSDGWVLVRVQDTGQEGWMAERLLSPANG